MLQLLNPHFSNKIRVYDDPFSRETASIGVAGIKWLAVWTSPTMSKKTTSQCD